MCLLGLAAAALAGPVAVEAERVESGSITGSVQVVSKSSRRLASAGAYPSRTVMLPGTHDQSELANVVVFVAGLKQPTRPTRATIRQVDEEFIPHLTAVSAGSTVEFPNDDLVFHNVFSLSRAATFDLGRYKQGTSRSRVFESSGLVKVFCQLHSHMNALVRVFDHPYFVVPKADGTFEIPNVPAGTRAVTAWHERVGEVTLKTTVAPGQASTLTFALPLTEAR